MSSRILMIAFTLVILAGYQQVKSQSSSSQSDSAMNGFDMVDKTGNIRKPSGYRDQYQAFGTYTVLDPKGDEMHYTYASPGAAEHYRKTGRCPR